MKSIQTHNQNLGISPFYILLIKLFNICSADSCNTFFTLIKMIKMAIYAIQKRAIYFSILLHCPIHFKICTKKFCPYNFSPLFQSRTRTISPPAKKKTPKNPPFPLKRFDDSLNNYYSLAAPALIIPCLSFQCLLCSIAYYTYKHASLLYSPTTC